MLNHLLICGLGSIGMRHLRHFRALGVRRIDAYRTGKATIPEDKQNVPDHIYGSLEDALAVKPQAVVVCNPTAYHIITALAALRIGAHVLIEKPLSDRIDGVEQLQQVALTTGKKVAVAFNLRFHPIIMAAKEVVHSQMPLGTPLMMRAHFGSYLPDWHPWEDYHISYVARNELGGGATLTHNHEIDYVLWLLGPVTDAKGFAAEAKPLGTDVDESSVIIMRHNSGAASSVTLSIAQKPATRVFEIVFTKGIFSADLLAGTWRIEETSGRISEHRLPISYDIDMTYSRQAAAFIKSIEGNADLLATLDEAANALRVALTIRREKL
jgi:predicted dehydrogenase